MNFDTYFKTDQAILSLRTILAAMPGGRPLLSILLCCSASAQIVSIISSPWSR